MNPEITQPQESTEPILEAQLLQSREIGDETNSLLEALVAQGEANNPEPILEATLAQSIKNTDKIVEAFAPTSEAASKMAAFLYEMKGDKGDKGDQGERGEKGDKGDPLTWADLTEEQIAALKGDQGEPGRDGVDGKDGRDGRDGADGRDGRDGADGKDAIVDYKKVVTEAVKRIPPIDIEKQVVKITDEVSKRTNDTIQSIRTTVATKTYALSEMEDMAGATVGQVPVKQADGSWAPGTPAGGSGVTVETPTGTVDASNTSFTVTAAPKWIVSDGIVYFEGAGYSRASLTITMDVPPSQFIRAII